MPVSTTVVGSYPKPPPEGSTFLLRKTLHARERGEATDADVAAAQDSLVREIIGEQEEAGIDVITDGHARWDDILTPFARHMAGVEIGGLLRWFDNNVYYRRPVITGTIEWRGPSSVAAFDFARSVATQEVKAVVPGAVTFARLSVDEHYGSHDELVMALASVLAQEIFELSAAGARTIQIDEPALLGAPEDLDLASKALEAMISQLDSSQTKVVLATYFDSAKRLGADLFALPADVFALDLVSAPDNFELIGDLPSGKSLQAGIVDARNTMLEDEQKLTETVEELVAAVGAERLYLSPSAGLEFLPREKAKAKLSLLARTAQKVGG